MSKQRNHTEQSEHEWAVEQAVKQTSTNAEPTELDYQRTIESDGVNCDVCGKFVPDDGSINSDKHGNVGCKRCCELPKPGDEEEDWAIVATYKVGVMKQIDGKQVSRDEAIEIAVAELREANPQDFEFEVS